MQKNLLQLEQSGWWVLLIIIFSATVSWWLYSKKKRPWNKTQNFLLAGIRFVGLCLLLFLLLDPLIKQVVSHVEKPIIAIGLDNTKSVTAQTPDSASLIQGFQESVTQLKDEGFEVRAFTFDDKPDSIRFSHDLTDLSRLLRKIDDDMEGRNWVGTVLMTDGIYNSGSSPFYRNYIVPQFLVGLGDTISPKDINLSRVQYNRISYKGNESPIKVEVSQKGFDDKSITVYLNEGNTVLAQQDILLTKSIHEIDFQISSEIEGLRKLTISTAYNAEEFISDNNRADIFMEVIDSKQKVLIIADAPHPDIKAIRNSLNQTDNYKTTVYIPALNSEKPTEIYDVIIYHGAFVSRINYKPKENPGSWYILNQKSILKRVKSELGFAEIKKRSSKPDQVLPSFNQEFSKFKLPEDQKIVEEFPPLSVPFGDYKFAGNVETLLYQRVGNVTTNKPLFTFYDDGLKKIALLLGQDIWKWKLLEAGINGTSDQFDELVLKTIQYLSVKNDKKQFRFQARGTTFSTIEQPIFDSEVYNDSYERVYGNQISVQVISESREILDFEFVDSEFNSNFKIPPLPTGIYQYKASTTVGDKTFADNGQIIIEAINREYLELAADHTILRNIATKTKGEYIHFSNLDLLVDKIKERNFKSTIRSNEILFPLVENPWLIFIILILFSSEWLLRKYWGGY